MPGSQGKKTGYSDESQKDSRSAAVFHGGSDYNAYMAKHKKRGIKVENPTDVPADVNQWAKWLVDRVTGSDGKTKNPAAVALGKLGGSKGGKARAENLSAKRRSQIAKNAAKTRWNTRKAEK